MQILQFYYSRDRVKNAALIRFLSVPAPTPVSPAQQCARTPPNNAQCRSSPAVPTPNWSRSPVLKNTRKLQLGSENSLLYLIVQPLTSQGI